MQTKSKVWTITEKEFCAGVKLSQLRDLHTDDQGKMWMMYCNSRSGNTYQFDYKEVRWNAQNGIYEDVA